MKILVTGAAGFIGFHVCQVLLSRGDEVVGIDNINDYYDVNLKLGRLAELERHPNAENFRFIKLDIALRPEMEALFAEHKFDKVVHLAAQAGVRYSIENPHAYIDSNIVGFTNILEGCRHNAVKHLVYASSSSVYGANESMPFSVSDNVDHPVSLYAASKKANELMAHTYSHLYDLPTTGLRFFTVYGPWGRPDMALFKFTKAILEKPDPSTSKAPWRVYNIGAQTPVNLLDFITTLESALGKTAEKEMLPMQPGDVPDTYANVQALIDDVGYKPKTQLKEGISNFVNWYKDFYKI